MSEFLDFRDISRKVPFKTLLDFMGDTYTETDKELKTELVVINKKKNLYFAKDGSSKGSVINYVSSFMGFDLRTSAKMLKKEFLDEPAPPKREIPNLELHYCPFLKDLGISEELAQTLKVGLVKQKSILAKKIAFHVSEERGYIGYDTKKENWFFPKGFKRDCIYDPLRVDTDFCILVPDVLECVYLIGLGFNYTVALMAQSATDEQIEALKRFRRVFLFSKQPENTVIRLSQKCFVKAFKTNSVRELNSDAIRDCF